MLAIAISHTVHPLSVIDGSTVQLDWVLLDSDVLHAFFNRLIRSHTKTCFFTTKDVVSVILAVQVLVFKRLFLWILSSECVSLDSGGFVSIYRLFHLACIYLLLLRVMDSIFFHAGAQS